jgi:hypothetical protein
LYKAGGVAAFSAVFRAVKISIVIRLLPPLKFVDRAKNSIVPQSNEFAV